MQSLVSVACGELEPCELLKTQGRQLASLLLDLLLP